MSYRNGHVWLKKTKGIYNFGAAIAQAFLQMINQKINIRFSKFKKLLLGGVSWV